jgi:hypothetical protein
MRWRSSNIVVDNQGVQHTLVTSEYDPKLYIPSQDFIPDYASDDIENAMVHFHNKLLALLHANRQQPRKNLPASSRLLLRELKTSTSHIILPTDKNLGPAIMEHSTYIRCGLDEHLLDSNTYRQLSLDEASKAIQAATKSMLALIATYRPSLAERERTYFHRLFQLIRHIPQFYAIPKVHKTP